MNIITMASRKGGAGKSTLTAHLAALCHQAGQKFFFDADDSLGPSVPFVGRVAAFTFM